MAVVHDPTRFHETLLKTFCAILPMDKQMDKGINITFLAEIVSIINDKLLCIIYE